MAPSRGNSQNTHPLHLFTPGRVLRKHNPSPAFLKGRRGLRTHRESLIPSPNFFLQLQSAPLRIEFLRTARELGYAFNNYSVWASF